MRRLAAPLLASPSPSPPCPPSPALNMSTPPATPPRATTWSPISTSSRARLARPSRRRCPATPPSPRSYNGAIFAFASAANRDRFAADPAAFAPQYDGHCAYGVAKGGKVPGNPDLWRIVDGKLYLNITQNVVGFWEEDIPSNISLAEGNWPGLEASAASDSVVPGFTSDAPVTD